jgi:outer membrane immunogenic protein
MKRIAGAALGVAMVVTPAMAADLIVETPIYEEAIAAAHDWSGPYAGVHLGWVTGSTEAPFGPVGGPLTTGNDPFDFSGWLAGAHLGVNFQDGSLVGGVEALVDWAPFSGDDADLGGDTNGIRGKFLGTLAGRIGFAADTALFYLSGGVAVLTADGVILDIPAQAAVGYTFFGGTVGAGVEMAFDENISARLDYRYYAFGQQTGTYPLGGGGLFGGYDLAFAPQFHTVSAGISVGF